MRSIKKTQKRGGQIVPNNNEYKSIAYTLSDEQKALNQRRCQEIDVQSTNLQNLHNELNDMKQQAIYNSQVRQKEAAARRAQSAALDKKKAQKRKTESFAQSSNPMGFDIAEIKPEVTLGNVKTKKGR